MVDVQKALEQFEDIDVTEARFRFLDTLYQVPFGNSEFFRITKVKCSTSPPGIPSRTPVLLAVNRIGLHFFREKTRQWLHTIDLKHITSFSFKDPGVLLGIKNVMPLRSLFLSTDEGEDICRTLSRHVQYYGREEPSNRSMCMGTVRAMSVENVSSSSSAGFQWDVQREVYHVCEPSPLGSTQNVYTRRSTGRREHNEGEESDHSRAMGMPSVQGFDAVLESRSSITRENHVERSRKARAKQIAKAATMICKTM